MKYPDPIPATPAPFLSDILRRGLQMDPRRTASDTQAHLAHTRRLLSPSSALGLAWRTREEPSGWTAATRAQESARRDMPPAPHFPTFRHAREQMHGEAVRETLRQ